MGKEGKVDVLSVLIVSIVIFVIYSVLVLGDAFIVQEFPVTGTNATATQGIADATIYPSMQAFNATLGLFQCNITSNATAA
ncbi:hypothetical protein CMO87_02450, partial [Candidatus Woesearchaeota archaeon]|nr:hypothetical protein [Candidatus Woesearchaeota archaeon]